MPACYSQNLISREICCNECDKVYIGDRSKVNKLLSLHIKYAHGNVVNINKRQKNSKTIDKKIKKIGTKHKIIKSIVRGAL